MTSPPRIPDDYSILVDLPPPSPEAIERVREVLGRAQEHLPKMRVDFTAEPSLVLSWGFDGMDTMLLHHKLSADPRGKKRSDR